MKIEVGDFVMTNDEFFSPGQKGIVIKKHQDNYYKSDGTPYYSTNSVTVYWFDYGSTSGVKEGYVDKVK